MRGLYTVGCLDVLMEKGIDVDGYIGVSAGVAFGCNYKSRQIGRANRYNLRFLKDPRYSGIRTLLRTGDIFGADFCYHRIPMELDPFDFESFRSNPVEFYCVATDVFTGKAIYHSLMDGSPSDLEWIRASASMPIVSRAVKVDGYTLFDGSVSDSIPVEYFMSIGYERNIVILTRPRGYRKKEGKVGFFSRKMLRRYPCLVRAMEGRAREYNRVLDLLDQLEKDGKVLILAPSRDLHVKRLEKDLEQVSKLYLLGREDAMRKLDEIRDFLSL